MQARLIIIGNADDVEKIHAFALTQCHGECPFSIKIEPVVSHAEKDGLVSEHNVIDLESVRRH